MVTGGCGTAARTTGLLGGILSYAVSEGIVPSSPVQGVPLPADNVGTGGFSLRNARRLGEGAHGRGGRRRHAASRHRRLALGADWMPLGEVEELRWSEVDEADRMLPAGGQQRGHRSGRRSGRPLRAAHAALRVPGNPYACLRFAKAATTTVWLARGCRFIKRADLVGATPHTMRHSCASVAGDLGYPDSTIGAAASGIPAGGSPAGMCTASTRCFVATANKIASEVYRQMSGEAESLLEMPRRALVVSGVSPSRGLRTENALARRASHGRS